MSALKIGLIISSYVLIVGLGLFVWHKVHSEIKRVEQSISEKIAKSANNTIKGIKTPEPIKEELKGKGSIYNPSKDLDRQMSGKHVDFY